MAIVINFNTINTTVNIHNVGQFSQSLFMGLSVLKMTFKRIISIFYQLENRDSCITNKLIPQKYQNSCSRLKNQTQALRDSIFAI